MCELTQPARAWLASGAPDPLVGFGFQASGTWPVAAGCVCDFATVPSPLGLEMLALSRRMREHPLGPVFADSRAHTVTFALARGAARTLPGVLIVAVGAPIESITVLPTGTIVRVPPPGDVGGIDVTWLQPPMDNPPHLPGVGTFAYLASQAALMLAADT